MSHVHAGLEQGLGKYYVPKPSFLEHFHNTSVIPERSDSVTSCHKCLDKAEVVRQGDEDGKLVDVL